MIPLDIGNKQFQKFLKKELNLTDKTVFSPCSVFAGSSMQEKCIGLVQDRKMNNILLKGSYEISGDAIIFSLELPGAPDPRVPRQEIEKIGLRPEETRIVGVCVRKEGMPEDAPEIQIIFIPY